MKYYNICAKKTFKKKDGTEKTTWLPVGTLRETEEGKKFLELNMFPETAFFVFEPKPKEDDSVFS